MTTYFNKLEFKKALSLMGKNPIEAKNRYEEYIEKYPHDYSAYLNYAAVLIILNNMEEAKKIIEYAENNYANDQRFQQEKEKVEYYEKNLLINKLKIALYEEQYEEFLTLYLKNKAQFKTIKIENAVLYAANKLGLLKDKKRKKHPYVYRQIIDYQENDLKEHIKNHLIQEDKENSEEKSIFTLDFPIDRVLEEVKKYIPSDKKICKGFYQDTYIFKYDYCGRDQGKIINYFSVICFHNTNQIITMCPSNKGEYLPYVDLNYIKEQEEKPKQKQLSQIEKFYKRYGNKLKN